MMDTNTKITLVAMTIMVGLFAVSVFVRWPEARRSARHPFHLGTWITYENSQTKDSGVEPKIMSSMSFGDALVALRIGKRVDRGDEHISLYGRSTQEEADNDRPWLQLIRFGNVETIQVVHPSGENCKWNPSNEMLVAMDWRILP